ncbi:hypothetical protein FA15DRAFT_661396 [Coprinopsis marcescibilis]|uniref:Uncharacterized protein n=1 Tax=Coprinopsis marcescibilis TaxID=230819 RepID=A0A5C3KBQ3_COPMA|nr:hypothetical protein FA15DRAFT_661396 [Coprinopsis marcescibilis]
MGGVSMRSIRNLMHAPHLAADIEDGAISLVCWLSGGKTGNLGFIPSHINIAGAAKIGCQVYEHFHGVNFCISLGEDSEPSNHQGRSERAGDTRSLSLPGFRKTLRCFLKEGMPGREGVRQREELKDAYSAQRERKFGFL